MPPILNPAPPWQPDRSDYIVLWHGCTALDKNKIEKGIDLAYCRVDTDFGRGFYTTTLERQARQWAWMRFYDWQDKNPGATGNQPVVLRFKVRRYGVTPRLSGLDDGLDKLLSLHFVLGDYGNEDFWSLVQHCRQSIPEDKKKGQTEEVHDHKRLPDGWYDLVTGPVAAFWEQRVAMDDADQLSFHTLEAVEILKVLIESGKKGNKDDYRWEPVVR
jgi:hypothetical protein